jgi:heme A synthase
LRVVHPFAAVVAGIVLALVAWLICADYAEVERADSAAGAVMALVALQIVAGVVDLFLLAPAWMQLVHLLLPPLTAPLRVLRAVGTRL